MENKSGRIFLYKAPDDGQEVRLDSFLASCSTGLSRSRIKALIKSGDAKVNNCRSKPSYKLKANDEILLSIPAPTTLDLKSETIEFSIIFEDNSLLVLNKPAGLVVHPGPGHLTGTLVHGLLDHCQDLSGIGGILRPGIVHRLDKDTSGILVIAKNDRAHAFLADQFKSGTVKKQYVALVHGRVKEHEGNIDLPVGRHPVRRKEMSIALSGGRRALTLWQKIEEFHGGFSLLSILTKTGRSHQIRVHLSHIGHPIAGDVVYGHGLNWWKKHPLYKKGVLRPIKRQMLHARYLGFIHPDEDRYLEFEAPIPDDMEHILKALRILDSHDHVNKGLDITK